VERRRHNADDASAAVVHQRHRIRLAQALESSAVQKDVSELVDRYVYAVRVLNDRPGFKYLKIGVHKISSQQSAVSSQRSALLYR